MNIRKATGPGEAGVFSFPSFFSKFAIYGAFRNAEFGSRGLHFPAVLGEAALYQLVVELPYRQVMALRGVGGQYVILADGRRSLGEEVLRPAVSAHAYYVRCVPALLLETFRLAAVFDHALKGVDFLFQVEYGLYDLLFLVLAERS